MKGYGQFCPLSLASEIVGERWTPLILRELLLGARRFNDIHRGVPRMSPSLLTRRLRTLEKAGVVARSRLPEGHVAYALTESGSELASAIRELAVWGKRWLPANLSEGNPDPDPDLVLWDMHRRLDIEKMPARRTVICFEFTDQPQTKRYRWIVRDPPEVEMCIFDPGYEPDLFVLTDSQTLTWVWYGDLSLSQAIDDGRIELSGPTGLCRAFPGWLQLSVMADIPRVRPLAEPQDGARGR